MKANVELQTRVRALEEQVRLSDGALILAERDLTGAYTERARLLSLLAVIYPSHRFTPDDADEGFHEAICIHFPWGQGTWHVADDDLPYFDYLPYGDNDYDGHTTEQKYDALSYAARTRSVGAFFESQ